MSVIFYRPSANDNPTIHQCFIGDNFEIGVETHSQISIISGEVVNNINRPSADYDKINNSSVFLFTNFSHYLSIFLWKHYCSENHSNLHLDETILRIESSS